MYSIDTKEQIITITAGTLTEEEKREVDDYINYGGYTTKIMRARTNTAAKISEKDIIELLKGNEKELAAYEDAKEQPSKKDVTRVAGFLGGKNWFIENHEKEYISFLRKTKQTAALEAFERNREKREKARAKANGSK